MKYLKKFALDCFSLKDIYLKDIFLECFNSFFLALSVLIENEAKCFRLKSDLQTLPRMADQLTFEVKGLKFINLRIFSGNTSEFVDSIPHAT